MFQRIQLDFLCRGKYNDGERVWPGLALETGDKEGVSTAAIIIALNASDSAWYIEPNIYKSIWVLGCIHVGEQYRYIQIYTVLAPQRTFRFINLALVYHSVSLRTHLYVANRTNMVGTFVPGTWETYVFTVLVRVCESMQANTVGPPAAIFFFQYEIVYGTIKVSTVQ